MESVLEEKDECRVANIAFAYKDTSAIKMLQERGEALIAGNMEQAKAINTKIEQLLAQNHSSLYQPVRAYVTFLTQDGQDVAMKTFTHVNRPRNAGNDTEIQPLVEGKEFLGEPLVCELCPEPQDIIWENVSASLDVQGMFWRKVYAYSLVAVILLTTFAVMWVLKQINIDNMYRYPFTTNCDEVMSIFQDRQTQEIDLNLLFEYAKLDHEPTLARQGTGMYQCYCKNF